MTLPDNDLANINEPKTPREMFQKIMRLIEDDQNDRAEDRELLEGFVTSQKVFNEKIDERIKALEGCHIMHDEQLKTLKEQSKKWDMMNTIVAAAAAIAAAIGITGS